MTGIHPFDIAVIVLYLVGITALGIWTARRVKNLSDFFMPRRFGKAAMIMHAFGTGTASDQAVMVASATAKNGLSGIWYQWMWLFSTPFYWLIAPIMRRFRALTTGDVFELRYNRSVAMLYAVIGLAMYSVNLGVMLRDLPDDNAYKVVFMRRNLDEVLASQNKMLVRRGEDGGGLTVPEGSSVDGIKIVVEEVW